MEVHGFIGIITMCNETKRNALSQHVCDELSALLDRCCSAGVRVVILRSSPGVKVWSSGHDVRDFKRVDGSKAQSIGGSKFQDPLSCEDSFVKLLDRIRNLSVPVIGSIEGTVWGGATDICACCDVLIATPQTSFAITPAKIGLPYNHSGMSHFIQVAWHQKLFRSVHCSKDAFRWFATVCGRVLLVLVLLYLVVMADFSFLLDISRFLDSLLHLPRL